MQKLAVACILLLIAVCRAEESEDHSVMQKLVGYFDGPLDAAETFASEWEARIESDFNSELWESEDDHEEQHSLLAILQQTTMIIACSRSGIGLVKWLPHRKLAFSFMILKICTKCPDTVD